MDCIDVDNVLIVATMSPDVDMELDLKKKFFKLQSLTQQGEFEVMKKAKSSSKTSKVYWFVDEENKEGWVKYYLEKN